MTLASICKKKTQAAGFPGQIKEHDETLKRILTDLKDLQDSIGEVRKQYTRMGTTVAAIRPTKDQLEAIATRVKSLEEDGFHSATSGSRSPERDSGTGLSNEFQNNTIEALKKLQEKYDTVQFQLTGK